MPFLMQTIMKEMKNKAKGHVMNIFPWFPLLLLMCVNLAGMPERPEKKQKVIHDIPKDLPYYNLNEDDLNELFLKDAFHFSCKLEDKQLKLRRNKKPRKRIDLVEFFDPGLRTPEALDKK